MKDFTHQCGFGFPIGISCRVGSGAGIEVEFRDFSRQLAFLGGCRIRATDGAVNAILVETLDRSAEGREAAATNRKIRFGVFEVVERQMFIVREWSAAAGEGCLPSYVWYQLGQLCDPPGQFIDPRDLWHSDTLPVRLGAEFQPVAMFAPFDSRNDGSPVIVAYVRLLGS